MTPRAEFRVLSLPDVGEGAVRVEVECPASRTGITQIPAPGCPELAVESMATIVAYRHGEECGGCDLADVHAAGDRALRYLVERASAARRDRQVRAYAADRRH